MDNKLNTGEKDDIYAFYQELHTMGALEFPKTEAIINTLIKQKINQKVCNSIISLVSEHAEELGDTLLNNLKALLTSEEVL